MFGLRLQTVKFISSNKIIEFTLKVNNTFPKLIKFY